MFSSVSGNKGSLQGRCWYCVTLFLIFLWRCLRKFWSRTFNLVCHPPSLTPSTLSPGGGLWWQPSPTWCCARPACCSTGQWYSYSCLNNNIQYRKDSIFLLGTAESKLLYTLHWILLFAMDECVDEDLEKNKNNQNKVQDFNFPISSITVSCCQTKQNFTNYIIQTFVYLFAPLCHTTIRETDFEQNMRLDKGKKIWTAMWEYRHPDVESFTAQVGKMFHIKQKFIASLLGKA